jgi:hypothetical protein
MRFLSIALAGFLVSAASVSAQTTVPGRNGGVSSTTRQTDCSYSRTTNGVGDIIFGRTNANTCRDVYSREDGAWYQVGRGRDNHSIYERRIRNSRGELVIQRARRNPNGTFTIISSRVATSSDKEWRKAQKAEQKAWKQQQKAEDKAWKEEQKAEDRAFKAQQKAEREQHDAYYKTH